MTLLTIIQDACDESGFDAPTSVVDSTDQTVVQMLALANRSGKSLATRFPWQEGIREFTHTTLAAELQGTVESLMPGFNWLLYETLWNRTLVNPVAGPIFPFEWQGLNATGITGPYGEFRVRQKKLYILPAPTAGQTVAGEYASRYWCASSGGTDQERWADDDDVGLIPEDLLTLDLIWRFLKKKGLDYAEEKLEAEMQINNSMARNGSNRVLNLAGGRLLEEQCPTGLLVPPGNWGL